MTEETSQIREPHADTNGMQPDLVAAIESGDLGIEDLLIVASKMAEAFWAVAENLGALNPNKEDANVVTQGKKIDEFVDSVSHRVGDDTNEVDMDKLLRESAEDLQTILTDMLVFLTGLDISFDFSKFETSVAAWSERLRKEEDADSVDFGDVVTETTRLQILAALGKGDTLDEKDKAAVQNIFRSIQILDSVDVDIATLEGRVGSGQTTFEDVEKMDMLFRVIVKQFEKDITAPDLYRKHFPRFTVKDHTMLRGLVSARRDNELFQKLAFKYFQDLRCYAAGKREQISTSTEAVLGRIQPYQA